jgi:CarboxypepD_reg-like domain/TonB-dependent Receptor Plug Domain
MQAVFTILLTTLTTFAFAQTKISGNVTDEKGEPVIGANVVIKGSYDGSSTGADGSFSFTTTETGKQTLVISSIGYKTAEQEIELSGKALEINFNLKEEFNELEAVVISAGSFTAGEEKRRTILKAVDIATTAGATADIAGALNTLPGTTKVGETGRLFVRGGDDSEARTFIDGMAVLNSYEASAPNTPTRSRFMPFMFKGTSFSTGGYSAEYGQALSSALILNSKDKAEMNQTDIGIISVGGEVAHTQVFEKSSVSAKIGYTDISPYYKIINQRVDWKDPYKSLEGSGAFRQQIGNHGGYLKLYGNYSKATLSMYQHDIAEPQNKQLYEIINEYAYGNAAYQQPLNEKWSVRGGLAYSYSDNAIKIDGSPMSEVEKGFHAKGVLEHSVSDKIELRFGTEVIGRDYTASRYDEVSDQTQAQGFDEIVSGTFAETEIYINNQIITRTGARAEYNNLTDKFSVDPRISVAYKPFEKGQFSLAYGVFRQTAKNQYVRVNNQLSSEKAEHYILNYQVITDNRTFRVETYYKKYDDLVKFGNADQTIINNKGNGFARGAEIFWRDSKTLKNVDYWVSYSFLDTKRNYLNYPYEAMPTYASKHNISVVYKHFINKLKSQVGVTYSYGSPRPYNNPNDDKFNAGRTPSYQDLSANISYLPKNWLIVYVSCTNLLGRDNIFGYQYSETADVNGVYAAQAIKQPARHFLLIGVFITISKNKSVNQLPNL